MEYEKLNEIPYIDPMAETKVTYMGNIIETQYMSRRNKKQTVQMLPGMEQYVVCATGEVKDIETYSSRIDGQKNLLRTFALARGIINTNVTDVKKVRWGVLTYAENMTDTERLYKDFKKFNMRFQYYCDKKGFGRPEYICMMEPQGRGAWHIHYLFIWQHKAPYIPNDELRALWGHGFVKVKKLDDVDNVGAYLTAYVGDMEVMECVSEGSRSIAQVNRMGLTPKEIKNDEGKKELKYFVKGGRLKLYPANFNMIRYSRGIKKPTTEYLCYEEAQKKVSAATKTFSSAIKLIDSDHDFETTIIKQNYNIIRPKKNQFEKFNSI